MAILTGPKLREEVEEGRIKVDPYTPELVGPNSIDLRLHPTLRVYQLGAVQHRLWTEWYENRYFFSPPTLKDMIVRGAPVLDMCGENETRDLEIPEEGVILWPGILYLGRTVETVGSKFYVPWFDGRSSVGRLGIHVHVTAGRGDTGWFGTVTLEIHVIHPIRVHANQKPICQASFFETVGELEEYKGRYQDQVDPTPSRFHLDEHDRL